MNLYSWLQQGLFLLDAERSHEFALSTLPKLERMKLLPLLTKKPVVAEKEVMGIRFPNSVGLAAGLDKNADALPALSALGFGFVEVGTVTPKPQPGNDKPRLFRLPEAQAIINRMGFNNKGIDHLVAQVKEAKVSIPVGINIGKNAVTPVDNAVDDYLIGLEKAYRLADYVTVNISSPNTQGLRSLQHGNVLRDLLQPLKKKQGELQRLTKRYVPLVVKIAPDLIPDDVREIAKVLLELDIDGVIATNTTLARTAVAHLPHGHEAGGLSGAPLLNDSTQIVRLLAAECHDSLPIIAAGGISSADNALQKIQAGASLVQIYSGFIYQGPQLVHECASALSTMKV